MWSSPPHLAGEDPGQYFLELIIDTLQQLEPSVQAEFLQKFLKSLAGLDISEKESVVHWQGILRRQNEMNDRLGRVVTLRTAAADYFSTALLSHNPILLEYQELKRLRHDAATDPLTGLYNRRMFEEYMKRELSRSRRYASSLVLLLIDVRNFKRANDTYGHAVGDEVLRSLARACVETIRGSDYAFRIGGDEFAVLFPQADSQMTRVLARRITERFEQYTRTVAPAVGLGLDYGVASYPEDGESSEKLFETADRNVYTYKQREKARQGIAKPSAEPESSGPAVEPTPKSTMGGVEAKQRRRHDRIPMEGTGARVVLRNGPGTTGAKVVDLSSGGFSFLLDEASKLPEVLHARLHVPPFHTEELRIRRVYTHRVRRGWVRVGCSFVA